MPQRNPAMPRLWLTPFAFLALIAAYAVGLAQEFTKQGFRNLAAIVAAAAVFLFCYARGPQLARSKATIPLVIAALLALFPSYLTDVVIHPHMFAAMLGYALLTVGILLAARAKSTRAQRLWGHAALLLALLCGVIYGSRAQVLVTVLGYGFYWASHAFLKRRLGVFGIAGAAGIVVGIAVLWYASPRFDETLRRLDAWSWGYTGSPMRSGRETLFRATLAGIAEAPWWGHGPGVDITTLTDAGEGTAAGDGDGTGASEGADAGEGTGPLPAADAPEGAVCMTPAPRGLLRDCRLLLAIRNTLAGDRPEALWTWNFNVPLGRWKGVSIAGQRPRIVGIDLPGADLTGQIPPELGALDQLATLSLARNRLRGAIPPELGNLERLQALQLEGNALSGAVPEELGKLRQLAVLSLSDNQLQGTVPTALDGLDFLQRVALSGNAFSGPMPPSLHHVLDNDLYADLLCQSELEHLHPGLLADCSALLAGRDELAGTGSLSWSRAMPIEQWQGVRVGSSPPRIIALRLADAKLNGRVPEELGALAMLRWLLLNGNMLVGQIPSAVAQLRNLEEVRLAGNDFSGPPPGQLFKVALNDLHGMLFCARTDTLKHGLLDDCEALLDLRAALAGEAQLNWRRSEPITSWHGVQIGGDPLRIVGLHLQHSGLSGEVPAALGNLDRLATLWLEGNRLRGALPGELAQSQRLRDLRVDATLLAQGAPAALCRLKALADVLADACARPAEPNPGLRADVDALLAAQEQLDAAGVLNWQPTLSIEAWDGVILAGEPQRVAALLLGRRGLAGRLPPALGRLTQLVELRLERNRLQGGIPAELGQLAALKSLHLGSNALRGAIPPELGNLEQLLALSLAENRLTGVVPSELGELRRLVWLRLAGNDIAGDMPPALRGVADHDIDMDLFCLPSKRGNPAQLEDCRALLAGRDELAGDGHLNWRATTPLGAWQGVSLDGAPTRVVALNLAGMGLTGRIPAALGKLTALQSLVLDGNALTGSIPANLRWLPRRQTSAGQGGSATRGMPFAWTAPSAAGLGLAAPPAVHGADRGAAPCGFPAANRGLSGDCRALLEARDVLAGGTSLNWSAALPARAWQGVALGGAPERVVGVDLAGVGLRGRIPAALGRLSQLAALRLNDNGLRGGIPAELGRLANLEALWLKNNSLDGPLPRQLIELPKLRVARLAGNELDGPMPRAVRDLDHDLDEYVFCLPLATASAGLLEDCSALLAGRDALSGAAELNWRRDLPLGRWQGVELAGDPPRVTGLDVSLLGLTGQIPPEFGRLVELRRLAVGGNALTGPVPEALARLPNLEKLHLFRPQRAAQGTIHAETRNTAPAAPPAAPGAIVGANADLRCASYNSGLAADCEALLGMRDALAGSATLNWHPTVPIEQWPCVDVGGQPRRVTRLKCANRGLDGRLPSALGDLDGVEIISLWHNALRGAIPPSLGRLSKLRRLNLSMNRLTGAIPAELSRLPALKNLLLDHNRLSGPIPPTLADLPKLNMLRLGNNALHGCSPPRRLLDVQKHDFSPSTFHCLPLAVGKDGLKRDAAILLAARDRLAGQGELNWSAGRSIAEWQGVTLAADESQGVIGLDLTGAGLTGQIPRQLGELAVLQTLNLGDNRLTGAVPPELAQLTDLQELNLENNLLTGVLPPALLTKRRQLVVTGSAGNQFVGPAQLEQPAPTQPTSSLAGARCRPAATIDMELLADCGTLLALRDALAGAGTLNWDAALPIAAWRGVTIGGEPARVVALDLPASGLTGRIPAELGKLTSLRRIVLSDNALTGAIPRELGELARLAELRLEGNALIGAVPPAVAIAADPDRRAERSVTPWRANAARTMGAGELAASEPGQENVFATPYPAALRNIVDHDLPPACPNVPSMNTGLLRDCESLLASRDALAGTATLNWSEATPMAAWQGVRLSGDPLRVTALELAAAGLNGRLPSALGSLERLETLRLDGNRLIGPIPPQLGDLKRLENLALAQNQLTGHIPPALGALPRLASLALGHNDFHAPVPPALRAVEQHDLDIEVFCPASGGDAPSLFSDCQTLLSVRDALAGRGALNWRRTAPLGAWAGVRLGGDPLRVQALELAGKGLDGRLPAALGNLDALLKLDLSGNALRGELPAELAKLARLDELRLADNRLSGAMPAALEALNLRVLRLAGNLLAAPPPSLRQLPDTDFGRGPRCIGVPPSNPELAEDCWRLLSLRDELAPGGELNWSWEQPIDQWQGVRLSGAPPRVTALNLRDLGLRGRLPAGLGDLSHLALINLSFNELTGPIPAELGKLRRLAVLNLRGNRLAGPIPAELGQLPRLETLTLSENRLTGHVPAALAQLSALARLRLKGNLFLDCSAPATLATSVPDHDFPATFLCHPLDWSPSLAPDAAALLAMRDALAGAGALNWREDTPMPAWEGVVLSPGKHARVEGLELSDKALTGRIPREIGNLGALKTLHLDGNALTGDVPPELGKLTRLRSLRLDGNHLHGPLPPALGGLNALRLLRLAGNSFEGLAPTALRQAQDHDLGFGPRCRPGIAGATGLQRDCGVLLAVRDELAGEVKLNWGAAAPIDFWRGVTLGGAPPRVVALDLTNLGLTGSIPPRLGDLDALASLRLGRNALAGTIPGTLGKLANLSELVLDGNALTGRIPRELGRLANLATLRLRNNGLHGAIPAELGRLGNLRQLALDNNALSGRIPRSLGGLSALQELWLAGNELAEATSHIQATPMLSRALRDASPAPHAEALAPAASGPESPGAAPTRPSAPPSQPTAPGSELFCTPGGAGNEELLRDCRTLLRSAMDWWGDPAALNWRVDVPLERWKGIGLSGQPARVTSIDVSGLGLRGRLPRPLTRLSALETLRMADNEFSGPIPPRLGRLRALRTMALERNNLTGPVPTSIRNLAALSELRLNDNAMTGHLVDRIERLPSLSTMRLGGNDFLGCVPEPVRGLGDRRLELDIDCGPTPWSKPPLIEDAAALMASRDALAAGATLNWSYDAPVTAWQGVTVDGSPPRVVALDLANVGLAGRIPGELRALSALVRLDLSGNALTGGVPPQLGQLGSLRTLSLGANRLTGELPLALDHLDALAKIEFEGNDFVGCPPPTLRWHLQSTFLPMRSAHCRETWHYRTGGQVGGALYAISGAVGQGRETHLAQGAHNLFLQMGLQTGLVGVGALGLLCMSLVFNLRGRVGRKVTPVQCLAVAGAAMAITHSAFDVFLLQYVMTVAVFVWMFLGIGTGLARSAQTEGEAQPSGVGGRAEGG